MPVQLATTALRQFNHGLIADLVLTYSIRTYRPYKESLVTRKEKRVFLAKRPTWLESKESELTSRRHRERAHRGSETATEKLR